MTTKKLAEWLDYQQRVHPRAIELGLKRVSEVWLRMGAASSGHPTPQPAGVVITVGGTNGKGSTVAFLEAMLAAAGERVGCYTSPHLLRYNERVRVAGAEVGDEPLISAFERIESARGDIPLTYFEFGTLAALWSFSQSALDVAVLEVGLGGRLDAVNIIDADAAVVTTVDLDHQDWLGDDRDSIGREKAGIFRRGRPAIIGMRDPPAGLLVEADRIGSKLLRAGHDFRIVRHEDSWRWECDEVAIDVPQPALDAPCQIDNVATAIAALYAVRDRVAWTPDALAQGVRRAHLAGRLQRFHKPGAAELVVDVAHNPQAARALADWSRKNPPRGRTLAVFGALSDKDVAGIVDALWPCIESWHIGSLAADTPRGLTTAQLHERIARVTTVHEYAGIGAALDGAAANARPFDRILAFGSFFVAATALNWAQPNGYNAA